MFKFALLCLTAVAIAQLTRPGWMQSIIGSQLFMLDTIHGHLVQYDDNNDLVMLVGRDNCYLIDADDNTWDKIAHNEAQVPRITEAIYGQITRNRGVTNMTYHEAERMYNSPFEQIECRDKHIFHVDYHPRHH
ncbi:uncharacterized protein [Littorina saxatilis]|uniref:Uncharacterized protein n=1 Tax=Littorina saxatilis TaxID=31220 RepID=A0AAN9G4C7_9CAEN